MSDQLAFSFNVHDCSGCMACVVACQDQNDLKSGGISLRQVTHHEKGVYPAIFAHISLSCMHCGDAPCLLACATKAIFRHPDSGIVDIDRDICIGCHSCELACPFGAPKFASDGRMVKCDLCIVRIENGMEPACVHTCTTGALQFGPIDEITRNKTTEKSAILIKAVLTGESIA